MKEKLKSSLESFRGKKEFILAQWMKYPMLRFLMLFVIASFFTLFAEHWIVKLVNSGQHPAVAQSVFEVSGLYQKLSSAGWRKPRPRFTALVEIDPEKDAAWKKLTKDCFCGKDGQRDALVALLRKIAEAKPKVIVIDKYFTPDTCSNDDPGTLYLKQAMREISQSIPIVVGRVVDMENRFLKPSLDFLEGSDADIREGIIHLDVDTRKVPLQWRVAAKEANSSRNHVDMVQ